jgi:spore coat polysaccharide biosynthesis protein SpsF
MSRVRSAVIIQARIGSSRLPGKVLMDLAGRTVLSHVIKRCAAIEGIDVVCCAVPDGVANDPVAEEAVRCGARVVRGPELDVLARYYKAAKECQVEVVMRVTSDCPVLDPRLASGVLSLLTDNDADYTCNNLPRSWPHGLDCEAFRFLWLERAFREANLPEEREHVSPYLRNHPEVRRLCVSGPGGKITNHRWTLDTELDLKFLRALFARLPVGPENFDYRVPLTIVESDPALATMNIVRDSRGSASRSPSGDDSSARASTCGDPPPISIRPTD